MNLSWLSSFVLFYILQDGIRTSWTRTIFTCSCTFTWPWTFTWTWNRFTKQRDETCLHIFYGEWVRENITTITYTLSLRSIPCRTREQPSHQEEHNINIRAAIIHVFGDFIQSVGVFLASIVIYCFVSIGDKLCSWAQCESLHLAYELVVLVFEIWLDLYYMHAL